MILISGMAFSFVLSRGHPWPVECAGRECELLYGGKGRHTRRAVPTLYSREQLCQQHSIGGQSLSVLAARAPGLSDKSVTLLYSAVLFGVLKRRQGAKPP